MVEDLWFSGLKHLERLNGLSGLSPHSKEEFFLNAHQKAQLQNITWG